MKPSSRLCLALCFASLPIFAQNQTAKSKPSTVISLNNLSSQVSIDLLGGAMVGFQLKTLQINPFTWKVTKAQMPANNKSGAVFQGHFLCLGRWGAPTDGEMKAGVPHNGQAGRDLWKLDASATGQSIRMTSNAPLDGISVERTIQLDPINAVYKVTEKVTNVTSIGRLFNMVQHATIGAPFLDTTTLIDSNAKHGFLQTMCYPNPSEYEFVFPNAFVDSTRAPLDLCTSNNQNSYVSTHIFADSLGWIVAATPNKGLLVGYVWKTKDYPWLNLWQQWVDGKLWAKGLEFGTTGIGKSYQELLAVDTRFHNRSSFFFLDATETVEKSYISFEMQIPADFKGVSSLEMQHAAITVFEKSTRKAFQIPTDLSLK